MEGLDITRTVRGRTQIVQAMGSLDNYTANLLCQALQVAVQQTERLLILDLTCLSRATEGGSASLGAALKWASSQRKRLAIVAESEPLETFRKLGIEPFFEKYDTLEEALGSGNRIDHNSEPGEVIARIAYLEERVEQLEQELDELRS